MGRGLHVKDLGHWMAVFVYDVALRGTYSSIFSADDSQCSADSCSPSRASHPGSLTCKNLAFDEPLTCCCVAPSFFGTSLCFTWRPPPRLATRFDSLQARLRTPHSFS